MVTKYGTLPSHQISFAKKQIQKAIFFLLIYVDPATRDQFPGIDVDGAIAGVQDRIMGFNHILLEPPELVTVMSLLEAARQLYNSDDFTFSRYRKLILDAGSEIMRVKEGDAVD